MYSSPTGFRARAGRLPSSGRSRQPGPRSPMPSRSRPGSEAAPPRGRRDPVVEHPGHRHGRRRVAAVVRAAGGRRGHDTPIPPREPSPPGRSDASLAAYRGTPVPLLQEHGERAQPMSQVSSSSAACASSKMRRDGLDLSEITKPLASGKAVGVNLQMRGEPGIPGPPRMRGATWCRPSWPPGLPRRQAAAWLPRARSQRTSAGR